MFIVSGIMLNGEAALKIKVTENLIKAICKVESDFDSHKIGDDGKALGIGQIHKVCIDDVNRILGYKCYSYDDRKNVIKSKQIMRVYLSYYGARYEKLTKKKATSTILCRIWNGGPDGYKKTATLAYARKVSKYLIV